MNFDVHSVHVHVVELAFDERCNLTRELVLLRRRQVVPGTSLGDDAVDDFADEAIGSLLSFLVVFLFRHRFPLQTGSSASQRQLFLETANRIPSVDAARL